MKRFVDEQKSISFSDEAKKIFAQGEEMVTQMPQKTQEFLKDFVEGKVSAGVCCDFDNTLVPTDEINRIFYTLENDPSQTKVPLCGLTMIDEIPVGVMSGNAVEYVKSRCAEPIQDFMLASPVKKGIARMAVYALNGGHVLSYDPSGAEDLASMKEYNQRKKMSPEVAKKITKIMVEEVHKRIKNIVLSGYEPLEIRAGETTMHTYAPVFQDRAGVQKCIVGVSKDLRQEMLSVICERANADGLGDILSIQPGGEYTIDCQMEEIKKKHAGREFMSKYEVSHLIYLGDAVYVKADGTEGNDYSMVRNLNTYVFAVNTDKSTVPESKNGKIQWIGSGPEASKIFLTWLLISRADHLYRSEPKRRDVLWGIFSYLGLCA